MDYDYIECVDCLERIKTLKDKSVDVCFTSPPYNRLRNDTYAEYDDTRTDYFDFLVNITKQMLRVAKKTVIVNVQANHFNKVDVFRFIGVFAENIKGIVIWEKTNPQPATNFRKSDETFSVTNAYEFFFVMGDSGGEFRSYIKTKNVVATSVNSQHFKGHGAVMKKEVCDWFLERFTKENDVVLDPFLGTGTTAVSCVEMNRRYIGYEISPVYYKMACQRLDEVENTLF